MALKLKYTSGTPLSFDGYDVDMATIKGGEIGRITGVPYSFPSTGDKAVFDAFDGYTGTSSKTRPVISRTLPTTAATYRPLVLIDEGTAGYGVAFGAVIGATAGQSVINPGDYAAVAAATMGPHSTAGSGKVTGWITPGVFGVTLDAVAASVDPKVSTPAVGAPLYATTAGKLTLTSGESFDTTTPSIVGRFIEFSTNGSLVTTPNTLAYAPALRQFTEMVISFNVEN